MPSLGADMEAGKLVEWLKQPGDPVRRGDVVAVVETQKGAIEVEIFVDGRIDELRVSPGTTVPVGTVLATVADGAPSPPAQDQPPKPAPAPVAPPVAPVSLPAAAPIVPPAAQGLRASPAARRLAAERHVDLAGLHGSGPAGAIIETDVLAALSGPFRPAGPAAEPLAAGPDMTPMRRAIAAAMARSKREIPHYYLQHTIELTKAQAWLTEWNASRPPAERLLMGALLAKATALALRDFPEFNGFYGADGFAPSSAIHLGLAIAIRGGGLAAPAIHNTDQLGIAELMQQMRDLVGRVRRGAFRSSEISDPTITLSSLGDRGVEMLLPVIYPPQVAIVGFGTPGLRPWVSEEGISVRLLVTATLGADHRVSDGHRGALFLRAIGDLLQTPETLA